MEYLWVGGDIPVEYLELILCRDVFHCRPSELKKERAVDILKALLCLQVEAEVLEAKKEEKNR